MERNRSSSSAVLFQLIPSILLAGFIFVVIAWLTHRQQQQILSSSVIAEQLDSAGRLRPLVDVQAAVRAMELVTMRLSGTVTKTVSDRRWRGDVEASVEAPVTYLYGVDLSEIESTDICLDPFSHTYLIRIPPPHRLAVEVNPARASETVTVTGTRLRTRAGEYMLGLARRDLYEEACRAVLSPAKMKEIHEESRRRVEELVAAVCGPDASVEVGFHDGRVR